MSWDELDDQEAKAKKVLGDDATMPPQKVDIQDLLEKMSDAFTKFDEGRDELEKQVESLEDAIDALKNGIKRVAADYETNDFGLDKKKKDDIKKIDKAQKLFSAFFAEQLAAAATEEKDLDELQKHIAQIGKYKGPRK